MKIITIILILIITGCASEKHKDKLHTAHDNSKYTKKGLNVGMWQERFENRDRDVYLNKDSIVESLNIKKGDSIVDIGAGTGFFLKQFSQKVGPTGKVLAVDISPGFIQYLRERKQAESISNLEITLGKTEKTTLKGNSVNKVFICDTFHHFGNPKNMLDDIKKILKPGGEVFIIDFDRVPGKSREWILSHIHKSKQDYINQIESHGFILVEDIKTSLKENFMLKFKLK